MMGFPKEYMDMKPKERMKYLWNNEFFLSGFTIGGGFVLIAFWISGKL